MNTVIVVKAPDMCVDPLRRDDLHRISYGILAMRRAMMGKLTRNIGKARSDIRREFIEASPLVKAVLIGLALWVGAILALSVATCSLGLLENSWRGWPACVVGTAVPVATITGAVLLVLAIVLGGLGLAVSAILRLVRRKP